MSRFSGVLVIRLVVRVVMPWHGRSRSMRWSVLRGRSGSNRQGSSIVGRVILAAIGHLFGHVGRNGRHIWHAFSTRVFATLLHVWMDVGAASRPHSLCMNGRGL
jgi:hypothetical protein